MYTCLPLCVHCLWLCASVHLCTCLHVCLSSCLCTFLLHLSFSHFVTFTLYDHSEALHNKAKKKCCLAYKTAMSTQGHSSQSGSGNSGINLPSIVDDVMWAVQLQQKAEQCMAALRDLSGELLAQTPMTAYTQQHWQSLFAAASPSMKDRCRQCAVCTKRCLCWCYDPQRLTISVLNVDWPKYCNVSVAAVFITKQQASNAVHCCVR